MDRTEIPYLITLYGRVEMAKLLVNMLRFASSTESEKKEDLTFNLQPKFPNLDEIQIEVKNITAEDAVWVKMSYYPGWSARIDDKNPASLRIFQAGPNMMMVFPKRSGDYTLRFRFEKTMDVQVGEIGSLSTMIAFIAFEFFTQIKKGWKTY